MIASYIIILIFAVFLFFNTHNMIETIYDMAKIEETQKPNLYQMQQYQKVVKITSILTIVFTFFSLVIERKILNRMNGITREEKKEQIRETKLLYGIVIVIITFEIIGMITIGVMIETADVDLKVYIKASAKQEQKEELRNKIENIEQVKNMEYVSEQEALDKMKEKFHGSVDIETTIFPSCFVLKVEKRHMEKVANEIENMKYVIKVSRPMIEK